MATPAVAASATNDAAMGAAEPATRDTATTSTASSAGEKTAPADPSRGYVLDGTAYTLPARKIELGLFYFGYGITDWLSVGTFPALWVAGPLIGGLVANGSVKVGFPVAHGVRVSLDAGPSGGKLDTEDTHWRGLIVPVTAAGTWSPESRQDYSLGVRYIAVTGSNQSDLSSQEVEGAAVTQMLQVILDGRYALTRHISIYARAWFQPWDQNLNVDGSSTIDEQTTIDVEGEAKAYEGRPFAVVAGPQFAWGIAHLRVGAGYGHFFLPMVGIPLRKRTFVPDLDFYVRF